MRTEIQTGVSDGEWIEVTNLEVPPCPVRDDEEPWAPVDGSEQVILGDLSILTDGTPVEVARGRRVDEKVATVRPADRPPSGDSDSGARERRGCESRTGHATPSDPAWRRLSALASRRRRPIAHRRQVSGPRRVHRLDLAGGPARAISLAG